MFDSNCVVCLVCLTAVSQRAFVTTWNRLTALRRRLHNCYSGQLHISWRSSAVAARISGNINRLLYCMYQGLQLSAVSGASVSPSLQKKALPKVSAELFLSKFLRIHTKHGNIVTHFFIKYSKVSGHFVKYLGDINIGMYSAVKVVFTARRCASAAHGMTQLSLWSTPSAFGAPVGGDAGRISRRSLASKN